MILIDSALSKVETSGVQVNAVGKGIIHLAGDPDWRVIVNDRYSLNVYQYIDAGTIGGNSVIFLMLDDYSKVAPTDVVRLSCYLPDQILDVDNNSSDAFDFQIANNSQLIVNTDYRYTTRAAMENDWGTKLLVEWTNLQSSQTTIDYARLDTAIFSAQDEVDRRLFHSVYATPLTGLTNGDANLIRDLTNRLAIVWLYDHRPGKAVDQEGRPVNLSTPIRKEVDRVFRQIISNQTAISAVRRVNHPSVVGV